VQVAQEAAAKSILLNSGFQKFNGELEWFENKLS
jgi:hypothetical protein